ncbi:MAG: holo-ACP synthase [Verrucomicrobia bacterium]|jgi:holo-[acyl-carrier protein] synthase|nr:holo-ACP synthase [Verrucomicrobiota bacterium]MBT7026018.1 holo-ACP synthase [Verrucomicrobiota bacterium]
MILGTGIDIVEVERIRASHEKFGERFTQRILLPAEIEYCLRHNNPAPFLAARFAAKEAISKAFGTGICAKLGWHDMEVAKHDSGDPYVVMHGKGLDLLRERGGDLVHLSISHTAAHATGMAILEKRPAG